MKFRKYVILGILLMMSTSVFAQNPSNLDLELQQEGILDKEFRYTSSPKTAQLYRETTTMINQATPIDFGDGVKMIQALQMPNIATYIYRVPISRENISREWVDMIKKEYSPQLKSTFCFAVHKHIHYRANNRREKFIYLDENGKMYMEIDIQASDCDEE